MLVNEHGERITPVQKTKIPYDCLNGKRLFKANEKKAKFEHYGNKMDLGKGYIHTCTNGEDAFDYKHALEYEAFFKGQSYQVQVFECVIPRHTPYYKGTYGEGRNGYASTQIRFVRRLD